MSPRKLTIQLAPLVDLLLIVTFCQFIEVQEKTEELSKRSADVVSQHNQAVVDLASVQEQLAASQTQLQLSKLDLDHTLARQRVLGELVSQLFPIPPDAISKVLGPDGGTAGPIPPEQMEKLRQDFQRFGLAHPGRMVEHLLSYEEIRKRADIWNLHIDAQGIVLVSAGTRSTRIRIDADLPERAAVDQFADELYAWYRTQPEPKSLVILLLTYDRDSRIYLTQRVRQALPLVVARMQADSGGRTRFEYADLGFRIE